MIRVLAPFVICAGVLVLLYGGLNLGPIGRPRLEVPAAVGSVLVLVGMALRVAVVFRGRLQGLGLGAMLFGRPQATDARAPLSLFRPSNGPAGGFATAGFLGTAARAGAPAKSSRLKRARKHLALRRCGPGSTHPRAHRQAAHKGRPCAARRV